VKSADELVRSNCSYPRYVRLHASPSALRHFVSRYIINSW
jgi:hypothetical protein